LNYPLYNFFVTSVLVTGISLGLKFSDRYTEQEKRRKEIEKEQLNTELAFLKNQINPHFFFNTLNNIYSLVQTNVNDGQKAILQLSKLMRYLLYETDKECVPISREIDFMKIYIELMRLRLTPKIDLQVSFPDSYPDVKISPLIFLPFIENAFKHGISNRTFSFIHIGMNVTNSETEFTCSNSLAAGNGLSLDGGSGIGLENVKKRLSLLYPDRHKLTIDNDEKVFAVKLIINPEL
jgi:LytS/YehU family sensor histidine kinase